MQRFEVNSSAMSIANGTKASAHESTLERMLWVQLRGLGLGQTGAADFEAIRAGLRISGFYERWLAASLALFVQQGRLRLEDGLYAAAPGADLDAGAVRQEWEAGLERWRCDPDLGTLVGLEAETMRALPEILTGKVRATDVLFPDGSMSLVEGVYKNNAVADYFNDGVAGLAEAYLKARLAQDAEARIRILEIGAGTGGTSARVFARLKPYQQHIAEYCYTDLSQAFLSHARQSYGPGVPYLDTRILDIGRPLAAQGFELGRYDMVIAANVLHATRNIRQSLRNAKAALCRHGLLVLNELSAGSLSAHITFGLLEGWWLYEDGALRIPGSPVLAPETWTRVLEEEGFGPALLPLAAARPLGQQIIAAESDGVVRQPISRASATVTSVIPTRAILAGELADGGGAALRERGIAAFKKLIKELLHVPESEIDPSEPLAKYGIDSISVSQLRNMLADVFTDVSVALFFDYQTIEDLVSFFLSTQRDALVKWVGGDGGHVQPSSPQEAPGTAPLESELTSQPKARTGWSRSTTPASADGNAGAWEQTFADRSSNPRLPEEPSARPPDAIAIVGMACRFPAADSVDAYWQMLLAGTKADNTGPQRRWAERLTKITNKPPHAWGAFLDNVDRFDPGFFGIPPLHAESIEPTGTPVPDELLACPGGCRVRQRQMAPGIQPHGT